MSNSLSFTAKLDKVGEVGGWWVVVLPQDVNELIQPLKTRGYLKIEATVGKTTWPISIMPWVGKGNAFMPIKAEVREAEGLKLGDDVHVSFVPILP